MKHLMIILVFSICNSCAIAQKVEIQYMANEGIKISSKDREVFIDAFFDNEFEAFDFLSVDTLKQIINQGKALRHSISLATHLHGDHFNPALTGEYLLLNPKSSFIAPQETISNFEKRFSGFAEVTERVKPVNIELHQQVALHLDWVKITIIRLAHMGDSPWKEAENLAYLVELQGKKVLHVGDALLDEENLKALGVSKLNIDAVVLPLGQMMTKDQKELINEHIRSKQILAAHIPIKYYDQAQSLLAELGYKNTLVLNKPLKTYLLD
ncbi:MBL fold metallo-hydrolase [Fulvivirga lutimaris]|uniref:MBL fold metallo-hydrolase n=1 Tax=Fulvivirga lutimaris TaxID=1819566 RepID=UPI0012BCDAFF|nr:MBL fold metallo-hydrolase [Fulvivirga lutimaris]MTI37935.1 hypothetical protein [Fulvivirga lutimaris]